MDPGLDTKLRAFFDRIEAATLPSELTNIEVEVPSRRRRTFNLFAGFAAAAVVAASVTVFAVELRTHHNPTPVGVVSPAPTPSSSSESPSAAPLKEMPVLGSGGIPESTHFVIPVMQGQGPSRLRTFVPQGTLYIQFDCAGTGPFEIASTNRVVDHVLQQCSTSSGVTTLSIGGPQRYDDKPLTLLVTAARSMNWQIYVAESRALLPAFTVRGDQTALIPVSYGTGSVTLPTFRVATDEWLNVTVACNSGSAADTVALQSSTAYFSPVSQSGCSGPFGSSGTSGSAAIEGVGSGPISVHVKADPSVSWEILITEGPAYVGLPATGDSVIGVPSYGFGSASITKFTPTATYSVAFSCSGVGSLTISSADFSQVATPTCGGGYYYIYPPAQVTPHPVVLSIGAPRSVAWEIVIFQGPLSTDESCYEGLWYQLEGPAPHLGNMSPQRLGSGACPGA
jgi:hypothetical protein